MVVGIISAYAMESTSDIDGHAQVSIWNPWSAGPLSLFPYVFVRFEAQFQIFNQIYKNGIFSNEMDIEETAINWLGSKKVVSMQGKDAGLFGSGRRFWALGSGQRLPPSGLCLPMSDSNCMAFWAGNWWQKILYRCRLGNAAIAFAMAELELLAAKVPAKLELVTVRGYYAR